MRAASEELERQIRVFGEIATALRRPIASESPDVGITVGVRFRRDKFVVRVETFLVDDGYGQSLSANDTAFDTFDDAVAFLVEHGFSVETLHV
jgi:hypothetical protein